MNFYEIVNRLKRFCIKYTFEETEENMRFSGIINSCNLSIQGAQSMLEECRIDVYSIEQLVGTARGHCIYSVEFKS